MFIFVTHPSDKGSVVTVTHASDKGSVVTVPWLSERSVVNERGGYCQAVGGQALLKHILSYSLGETGKRETKLYIFFICPSSGNRLCRDWSSGQASDKLTFCHTEAKSGDTRTSYSAGHNILTSA